MQDFGVKPSMVVPSFVRDRVIDIHALHPSQVFVEDIADTLSKGCRYAGRCPYPYSIAQHAVFTSYLVGYVSGHWEDFLAYEALHHDDTEAYIGDIMGPFKRLLTYSPPAPALFSSISEFEAKIRAQAIAPALRLLPEEPEEVKRADLWALRLEQRYLQGREDVEAPIPNGWTADQVRHYLRPLHWRRARDLYLDRHLELYPECTGTL